MSTLVPLKRPPLLSDWGRIRTICYTTDRCPIVPPTNSKSAKPLSKRTIRYPICTAMLISSCSKPVLSSPWHTSFQTSSRYTLTLTNTSCRHISASRDLLPSCLYTSFQCRFCVSKVCFTCTSGKTHSWCISRSTSIAVHPLTIRGRSCHTPITLIQTAGCSLYVHCKDFWKAKRKIDIQSISSHEQTSADRIDRG